MEKRTMYWAVFSGFILELFLPLIIANYWTLRIFMFANIFVIFAISSDILLGYAGLLSFGQALFFGGAGYVGALLNLHFGLPLILCIAIGCGVALILGLFIGYICLRLKGPYLGVVTLIFPVLFITILHLSPAYLGGDNGIAGFAQIAGGSMHAQFYIVLVVTLASLLITIKIALGNMGLILKAIREDEMGAEAVGINATKYKVFAFAYSAVFGGLAGTLYSLVMGSVAPTTLSPHYSIYPIIMIYLGGASSIIGATIGAYVITYLDLYLLAFPFMRIIIYAGIIIVVLRCFPDGLMGIFKNIGGYQKWLSLKSKV